MSTTTTTISDADLTDRAAAGDLDSLRALIERHAHPAWRIAMVAAGDPATAEAATIDGFTDGLLAARRNPDPSQTLRIRLVAATRRVAAQGPAAPEGAHDDPVIHAFLALPEKSRTALWLTEVEGGTPEQVAPVLGLDRSAAAALADRAASGLRDRLAATVAERAADDECRKALSKLPAHAVGKLTAAERTRVGDHVGSCGACAVWLAALVSPRPALRRLVGAPPATLSAAIEARWLEHLERERKGWLAPFTERAVGAAAAAVLAIGLGGVAFLGDRDDNHDDRRAELAVPASADPSDTGSAALTPPTTASAPSATSSRATASRATANSSASTVAAALQGDGSPGGDRARSIDDPIPNEPPTEPPVGPPAGDPPPPVPDENTTQISVTALQGLVAVGVGDCTGLTIVEVHSGCVPLPNGAPLSVTIDLPGLPPIGI